MVPQLIRLLTCHQQRHHPSLRHQTPQTQIVHHILDILDAILDTVAALAQSVVLEVQDLKPGVHVFDELRDLQGAGVVAEGYGVAGKAGLEGVLMREGEGMM